MKRTLIATLLIATAAGCGDSTGSGGGGGNNTVGSVTLSVGTQQNLTVGGTLQLTADVRTTSGAVSSAAVTWTSTNGTVASVSGTGLVTALAAGSTNIIAAAGSRADTVAVVVQGAAAFTCNAGNTVTLNVGGVTHLSGTAGGEFCAAPGAEYVVVPTFTGNTDTSLSLTFSGTGIVAAAGPPSPDRLAGGGSLLSARVKESGAGPDHAFHVRLRERTDAELTPLVPGAQAWYRQLREIRRQTTVAPPAVGSLLNLNGQANFACTNPNNRVGRVMAVGTRSIIVEDTLNPQGVMTQADYQNIAATFDTAVWVVNTDAYGAPADIDNNGRVIIFYTRVVNELTPAGSSSYVGGFFYGRDLFPRTAQNGFSACANSNVAEMFYMLAADPAGVVNGNQRSKSLILSSTISTVAHEFQHLISASRRLYVLNVGGSDWSEDTWLNEGMSHIAEELLYYRRAGLLPRSNISVQTLQAGGNPAIDAYNDYASQNFGRLWDHLEAPSSSGLYDDDDDLATRGAAWMFLRYLADRRAGDDRQLWFDLLNHNTVGLTNVSRFTTGGTIQQWIRDWHISVYTDDAVTTTAEYRQPSWNYRSIYGALNNGVYPLAKRDLANGTPLTFSLRASGAAYVRFGVAAGGQAAPIQVRQGANALPATVTISVVRTK